MRGRHARGGRRRLLAATLAAAGSACVAIVVTQQPHPPAEVALSAPYAAPLLAPQPAASSSAPPRVLAPALPTRLTIPAIGVRSALLTLGQAADGTLAVPPPGPTYDRAGWYRYSPVPGARGPAVIVGHVDSAKGGPSVFFRLGELRPRDKVMVARADGSVAVFAVDEVRRFHKTAFPAQLVYGDTDQAALRLITCGGPFDRRTGHYLDNIVVTATLVESAGTA